MIYHRKQQKPYTCYPERRKLRSGYNQLRGRGCVRRKQKPRSHTLRRLPRKKANKNRKHCGLARCISPSVLHSFLKYRVFLQTRAAPNEKMRRHKLFNLLFRRISIQVQSKNAVIRGITSDEISLNKILQTSGAMASVSVCLKCPTLCSAAVKLH